MILPSVSWLARKLESRIRGNHWRRQSRQRIRRRAFRGRTPEELEGRELLAAELVAHWSAETLESAPAERITTEWSDSIAKLAAHPYGAPHLVPEGLNGHAVVRFDARDQMDLFRVASADNPLANADDFSVVAVFATDTEALRGTAGEWFLNSGIVDTSGFGQVNDWGIAITKDGQIAAGIGAPATTVYSEADRFHDGLAHVAVLTRQGSSITLYVDNAATQRHDASDQPRAAREIRIGAGGLPFTGDVAEIRLYDGHLDSTEVQSLTAHLLDQYLNLWPVADDDDYEVAEDQILTVHAGDGLLANDRDPEGAVLSAQVATPAEHGRLELARDGSFIYQPDPNFFGKDHFTYRADDGLTSRVATVTIDVVNQPDAPTAFADFFLGVTNQVLEVPAALGVIRNDANPDQTALTAFLVSTTEFGELDLRPDGSFSYRPDAGFAGPDRFRYALRNGQIDSLAMDVEIDVQRHSIVLSEWMASNLGSLTDEDGDSPDWIELFNFGSQVIDLNGWYLTDRNDDLMKWQFPAVQVDPGEFLVVFASGKDHCSDNGTCHASFRLDSSGEFLALVQPDGQTLVTGLRSQYPPQLRDVSYGLPLAGSGTQHLLRLDYAHLTQPTPGTTNADANRQIGPLVTQFWHTPHVPLPNQDLTITAEVFETLARVASATLHVRVMYGDEHTLPMFDDGTHGDLIAADGNYTAIVSAAQLQEMGEQAELGETSLAGKMLRYAVTMTDEAGRKMRTPPLSEADVPAAEYEGTVFEDPAIHGEIPVLHWFVPDPTWHQAPLGNSTRWSPASVYYDGEFYDNLKVRVRGISTVDWPKPKWKFEFNPGEPFRYADNLPRVDEFNLQSHFREKGATSYMGENLAFSFLQEIGVAAPNTFHLHVRQNGQFYSLASFVEQIDESFLQRNGLDDRNSMYKANSAAARSTLAPNPSPVDYQKVTRQSEPFDDLRQFTAGIDDQRPDEDRARYLFDHVNLPQVINNMAGNTILTNHDRLTKNYYMYRDMYGSGEWSQFPWDMDQAFAKRTDPNYSSVLYGDTDHPQATGQPIYQNHLLDAILDTPITRAMYLRRLRTLLDEFLVGGFFETWIDQTVPRIDELAARDHAMWSAGELSAGVTRLKDSLEFRRQQLQADPLLPASNQAFETVTLIDSQAPVRVRVPTQTDDLTGWLAAGPELDDSPAAGWRTGTSGVGYERNTGYEAFLGSLFRDAEQQHPWTLLEDLDPDGDGTNQSTTVVTRFPFTLQDPIAFDRLQLRMRYDDAFVAFLNGQEIARANFEGIPRWNTVANAGNHEATQEFELFDVSFVLQPGGAELLPGENVLSVLIINANTQSPDLLVQPSLVGLTETAPQFDITFGQVGLGLSSETLEEEYFELRNLGSVAVDLSGWRIQGAVELAFQAGTVLPAGSSLFLSPDVRAFRERSVAPFAGQGLFVQGPYSGRVAHATVPIQLVDTWQQVVSEYVPTSRPTSLQQFLRVSELHYNPTGDDATEFLELFHTGERHQAETLDLSGVTLTDGPADPFVLPAGTLLAPQEYLLIVKDPDAFRQAYPHVSLAQVIGPFVGSFANEGEIVEIRDSQDRVLIRFAYSDDAPWPAAADGHGPSLEVVSWAAAVDLPEAWQASSQDGGTPGRPRGEQIAGDLNGDQQVNAADIDRLHQEIRRGTHQPFYDLTEDGLVDEADLERLVRGILDTRFGDSNLDGQFDSNDIVHVFQHGEYEDELPENSGWSDGDWNGDGEFDSHDFVMAWQSGGYSSESAERARTGIDRRRFSRPRP